MEKKTDNSDFEVITRIRKGDTSAFRLLVEKYKDVSFSLACSIVRNEYDAEDALQDAFLKAYNNLNKFRFQSSFSTWLYRIVVNTCITIARRKQKEPLPDHDYISDTTDKIHYDTGFESMINVERKVIINKILDNLKSEEALLLRLYYLSELDVKEIMQVTGFKESKIKVTLFRARKSMQQQLQKIFGNEMALI